MSAQKNRPAKDQPTFTVPLALRVGGAFMALAVALLVFTVVAVFRDGWMAPFVVTPSVLMILLAAAIFGAFATIRRDQAADKTQVVALVVAVVLVVLTRFVPNTALFVMGQYWLAMYTLLAVLCALILRRSLMPKG